MKVPARSFVFALFVAGLAPLASSPASAQQTILMQDQRRTIAVSGEAEAMATPDQASVSAGVHNQARTAREAMDQTSRAMRAVLDALKALGIEERDVRTANLNLQPVIEYQQPAGRPRVVGYTATNTVTIRVRDLARLGDVLDRVTTAGANQMNGLQLTVSDWSAKMDEARTAAVADARRKAELMARAAGARLGRVVTLQEQGGMVPPRPRASMETMAASARAAPEVPIAAGEQTFRMVVSAVWELAD